MHITTGTMALSLNVQAVTSDPMYKYGNRIVLRDDGKNWLSYKAHLPVYLQSAPYAWEVIQGDLDPVKKPTDRDNYIIGNKNGREIIFSTLTHQTVLKLFFEDSIFVTAKDAWDRINERYAGTSAIFADIAITKYTNFRFNPNVSVSDNLTEFQTIMYELQETKAGVTTSGLCSRLLNSLPESYRSH